VAANRLLMEQVVSEVVSTFLLVFVTCGAAGISASDRTRISQLGQSVAGGLIVTVMIYAVGHISGAHMNPAVTLAFAVFRHFPWIQVRILHSLNRNTATITLEQFFVRILPNFESSKIFSTLNKTMANGLITVVSI
jgi:hypothetical protein